jgi:quercetin dioxygenase-like cupin family protein
MPRSIASIRVGLALATGLGLAATAYAQSAEPAIKLPNEIEFKQPIRPGGPSSTVIYGDPKKPGLYVTRVKFEQGAKNMPHWHPDERTVVILSGTFYFAYGEQWDESKLKPLPAGTFLTEPPKTAHFNWAKDGEVVLQVTGYGPTDSTLIPQKP